MSAPMNVIMRASLIASSSYAASISTCMLLGARVLFLHFSNEVCWSLVAVFLGSDSVDAFTF